MAIETIQLTPQQAGWLASAVKAERRELHRTQDEVAKRGGISVSTLTRIENAAIKNIALRTLDALDVGLDWQRRDGDQIGSAERVAAGGSPLPADHPRAVVRELVDKQGRPYRLVEAMVDSLPGPLTDRDRWIELWDKLSALSPDLARIALRQAEVLLADPDDSAR